MGGDVVLAGCRDGASDGITCGFVVGVTRIYVGADWRLTAQQVGAKRA